MTSLQSENRKHKRYETSLDVDAVIGNKIVQSTTRDICSKGIFINTSIKSQSGEDACIIFSLPKENGLKPVKLYGKTVRVEQKGIAIQFEGLSPYFIDILEEAIQRL